MAPVAKRANRGSFAAPKSPRWTRRGARRPLLSLAQAGPLFSEANEKGYRLRSRISRTHREAAQLPGRRPTPQEIRLHLAGEALWEPYGRPDGFVAAQTGPDAAKRRVQASMVADRVVREAGNGHLAPLTLISGCLLRRTPPAVGRSGFTLPHNRAS